MRREEILLIPEARTRTIWLRLCRVRDNAGQILNASKHPLDSPEEPSAGSELGRKDSDAGSASELVALIEHIRYVEPEFERSIFFRQVKQVGEA